MSEVIKKEFGERTGLEIAVIGLACHLPGAGNTEEFWDNLKNGRETMSFFSDEEARAAGASEEMIENPNFIKARGVVSNPEHFDAGFFGYSPVEAEMMDPQFRLFYQCTWEALEDSGYDPDTYTGLIGLYCGATNNRGWEMVALLSEKGQKMGAFALDHLIDRDFLSTRIAYKLNLRGPAITLKTACSTGLVALDMGCRGLLTGQCDIALAGGVSLISKSLPGYMYREGMINSPDGHIRAFDEKAGGVVFSEGSAAVVLKRLDEALEDRDNIYAVVKASALNNDGARKGTYEAPCIEGQEDVIRSAIHLAEVPSESISYVECHGTGTIIGDPIEIEALRRAFDTDKKGFCRIGSVKTNFGHVDTSAGIVGFVKTVLAMKHKMIPPSLNFNTPNPKINFADSPFVVNAELTPWVTDRYPIRAGVSSFGVGGTNAHVILEEAPQPEETTAGRQLKLMVLSTRSQSTMENASENLVHYLKKTPEADLADVAFTLQKGRKGFKVRKMAVVSDVEEAVQAFSPLAEDADPDSLQARTGKAKDKLHPVFMFSGQGAQYVDMARGLYDNEPRFREEMDRCFDLFKPLMKEDLKSIIYPAAKDGQDGAVDEKLKEARTAAINNTAVTQPALFALEYSLAKLLESWGVKPHAMIGHSIGEYAAACLSGVFSLEDAVKIVATRGRLMQQMPGGAMMSVTLPEAELKPLVETVPGLSMAAVNGPTLCVVSGPHDAVDAFEAKLTEKEITFRRLHTSHAFHSDMMEPMLREFEAAFQGVVFGEPQIPYVSNLTGGWITVEEAQSPSYWSAHLRRAVRFNDGLKVLVEDKDSLFVEVGPGRGLATFVKKHGPSASGFITINLVKHPKEETADDRYFLDQVGRLWLYGQAIDWDGFYGSEIRRRLPLPTYPFDRQHFAVKGSPHDTNNRLGSQAAALTKRPEAGQWLYTPSWNRSPRPLDRVFPQENGDGVRRFLVFVDEPGLSVELADALQKKAADGGKENAVQVTYVRRGPAFSQGGEEQFTLNPGDAAGYDALISQLKKENRLPHHILHAWNVTGDTPVSGDAAGFDSLYLENGFYSLLYLAQAIGKEGIGEAVNLTVLADGLHEVNGDELLFPQKATLLGPVNIVPTEFSNIRCGCIDIQLPPAGSKTRQLLLDQLTSELMGSVVEPMVAFRGRYRLVQTYSPLPLEASPKDKLATRIKRNGVYLITGGLGGIGLEIARYLAQNAGAKLVLTGRSPLPAKEEWLAWLDSHEPRDAVSRKIRIVMELEANGAEVLVLAADVADETTMQKVVGAVEERWGKINGLFHAAGLPGGGMIQLKTVEEAASVLAPKVQGTLLLHRLLQEHPLDFIVLCSSINSVVPMMGQVDYFAANAFLDAYAFYNTARNNTFTVSINWDSWKEVGMAVEAAKHWGKPGGLKGAMQKEAGEKTAAAAGTAAPAPVADEIAHPFFNQSIEKSADKEVFVSYFQLDKHWVLNEHKVAEFNKGLAPGVTYLEMARQAYELHVGPGDGVIEISDAFFFGPLLVGEGETVETRLTLTKKPDHYQYLIESRLPNGSWQKHSMGNVTRVPSKPGELEITHDVERIGARCTVRESILTSEDKAFQSGLIVFGERWDNLRRYRLGENEALAYLELPEKYRDELGDFKLHPSLLDSATGFLFGIITTAPYIPFGYKRLRMKAPMTGKLHVYSRILEDLNVETPHESIKFDIIIMNEDGVELIEIKEFTMRLVSDNVKGKIRQSEKATQAAPSMVTPGPETTPADELDAKQREMLRNGIKSSEGIDVLCRALENTLPQVVVCTVDLNTRLEKARAAASLTGEGQGESKEDSAPKHARPEISSIYVAPRSDLERQIAEAWQQLLGIEKIGINDDFFELGGDSLNIVQLNTELKKGLNRDIPVAVMFQHQTIHSFAKYLESETGEAAAQKQEEEKARDKEIQKGKNRLKQRMKRR